MKPSTQIPEALNLTKVPSPNVGCPHDLCSPGRFVARNGEMEMNMETTIVLGIMIIYGYCGILSCIAGEDKSCPSSTCAS